MNWRASIRSDINREFVSNPEPQLNETITVRLRHLPSKGILEVLLACNINGCASRILMQRKKGKSAFIWYSCELTMSQQSIRYYFIIRMHDGSALFYSRDRITTYHPDISRDFILEVSRPTPSWVKKTVFYHIYPDRFAPDTSGCGVQPGEYTFDGHKPEVMPWEAAPLEYEEGHCLDFFNGTLKGIEEKIPYLKTLGITALYLNPIFTGMTTHRYDCTDYFRVDPHLGGDEALISLSEALHREGMRIILDVSINHTGVEHPWFKKAQEDPQSEEAKYYYRNKNGNFAFWLDVPTLPQLRYSNPTIREKMISGEDSLVRHYMKPPFNIDGWRFDVAAMTGRRDEDQLGHELFQEIRRQVLDINPDAYIIGEEWEDASEYLQGDQWHSAMNYFGSARPIRRFLGELDRFIEWHTEAVPAPPTTGTELAAQLKQQLGGTRPNLLPLQFNLLDSHDIHRIHHDEKGFQPELHKGVVALLFLLPGTPGIYYGDEVGIAGHSRSVEGCRFPMPWQEKDLTERAIFRFHQLLIGLKKSEPALSEGSYGFPYTDETGCLFVRFLEQRGYALFLNRSSRSRTLLLPLQEIAAIAASNAETGEVYRIKKGQLKLKLRPYQSPLIRLDLAG